MDFQSIALPTELPDPSTNVAAAAGFLFRGGNQGCIAPIGRSRPLIPDPLGTGPSRRTTILADRDINLYEVKKIVNPDAPELTFRQEPYRLLYASFKVYSALMGGCEPRRVLDVKPTA